MDIQLKVSKDFKKSKRNTVQNPVSFCKDVKKNPSKYPQNIRGSCNSLLARQPKKKVNKKSKKKK